MLLFAICVLVLGRSYRRSGHRPALARLSLSLLFFLSLGLCSCSRLPAPAAAEGLHKAFSTSALAEANSSVLRRFALCAAASSPSFSMRVCLGGEVVVVGGGVAVVGGGVAVSGGGGGDGGCTCSTYCCICCCIIAICTCCFTMGIIC